MPDSLTAFTDHHALNRWIAECAELTGTTDIYLCDGSAEEAESLSKKMVTDGILEPLNAETFPNCFLHRSDPRDVARVEDRTFICSPDEGDAGPTNHWMSPDATKALLRPLFASSMVGKTMYVVPYLMGPVGSPFAKVGVEITDSPYVALSMGIMTRMGRVALDALGTNGEFVLGLHATNDLDPANRYICHFPAERLIWSVGSNYGGNALLGKKCFALRIASAMARDEGWMAEHMLLLELTDPEGEKTYFAGAFPSACGKTNLAMLVVPDALAAQGWRVRTVGDDIAWLHVGADGRLWAINPEAGFFGVAPGTSPKTNPNAVATVQSNTVFTNVAVTETNEPWWEGLTDTPPGEFLTDWRGNVRPASDTSAPFAQPNSRFTAPASQCPSISPEFDAPGGVPIAAILLGGRRRDTVPLVAEAFDWNHGVFLGAVMASETTAAAEGAKGVLRRDPFAMLPFCGYHMGDYFAHWLSMGKRIPTPPAIFHVNWFRRDADGKFLWPGFGENVRALIWMRERLRGNAGANTTAFGNVPPVSAINTDGLNLTAERLEAALAVSPGEFAAEADSIETHFARFGDRLPPELRKQLAALRGRSASGV
ncbi:MAG: phosphoenolpyruvate carboxykinase (GTP) [Armatimonadetes bacterium]|nr:phosphoenolpyruvate carboxykinase (GTP) [Armatimonadota bacterium]